MPFADSYESNNASNSGMHARPVIGGVFIRYLTDKAMWKKWSAGDTQKVGPWAPLPKPPVVTEVVPTAATTPSDWQYTTTDPAA